MHLRQRSKMPPEKKSMSKFTPGQSAKKGLFYDRRRSKHPESIAAAEIGQTGIWI